MGRIIGAMAVGLNQITRNLPNQNPESRYKEVRSD